MPSQNVTLYNHNMTVLKGGRVACAKATKFLFLASHDVPMSVFVKFCETRGQEAVDVFTSWDQNHSRYNKL